MSKKQGAETALDEKTDLPAADPAVSVPQDPAVEPPAEPDTAPIEGPAAEPKPLWEPHEEVPSAGGSYVRQPDGTLIKAEEA